MVAHTGVIPVGGDHFTNDVAVGLRTPLVSAEKIKKQFGHTISSQVAEGNEIEVPAVGDRPSRLMPQRFLAEILEPRALELCELMRDHLKQAGAMELCPAGVVLTGGGSRMTGLAEVCQKAQPRPAGRPEPPIADMPERWRAGACHRSAGDVCASDDDGKDESGTGIWT
jgi:cell division protein FtsA